MTATSMTALSIRGAAALLLACFAVSARAEIVMRDYPLPDGMGPHDVAPAPDGGVWFTAQPQGALGRLDPATGKVETIKLGEGSAPHGVIVGPDGAAWVTDGGANAIVRVDAGTRMVKRFPLPAGQGFANLNTAAFDRAGILWFTGQDGVYGRLDPARAAVKIWPAPRGGGPYGITAVADGVYYSIPFFIGKPLTRLRNSGRDAEATPLCRGWVQPVAV